MHLAAILKLTNSNKLNWNKWLPMLKLSSYGNSNFIESEYFTTYLIDNCSLVCIRSGNSTKYDVKIQG